MKAFPLGGYVKIAGMNPYEPRRSRGPVPSLRRQAHLAARAGDPGGTGSHFIVAAILFAALVVLLRRSTDADAVHHRRSRRRWTGRLAPARPAGMEPGDRIVGVGGISGPDARGAARRTRPPRRAAGRVHDRTRRAHVHPEITPESDTIGGETIGRIGVTLGPAKPGADRPRSVGGVEEVGNAIGESIASDHAGVRPVGDRPGVHAAVHRRAARDAGPDERGRVSARRSGRPVPPGTGAPSCTSSRS